VIAGQYPGAFAVSTDAGVTWTNVMTNGYWTSVASSADGTKLLAAAGYLDSAHVCGIFLSTNSGASWISNSFPTLDWGSVAMSADGGTVVAAAIFDSSGNPNASVFCSTNSGVNWASNNLAAVTGAKGTVAVSVAMSADGRKIFVSGAACYSTNSGTSWIQMTNAPSASVWIPVQTIAASADGNRLILCLGGNDAGVYVSTNSGTTWNLTSLPQAAWGFVASSADGQTLMAASGLGTEYSAPPGPLYISTNSGASWTTNASENWTGVACSADGGALLAVAASDANLDGDSGAIYSFRSVQSPLLNTKPSAGNLQLSWLIPSTDFVLEQSADLNNWTSLTNRSCFNPTNLEDEIMVSPTNSAGFYRLAAVPNN
jgi:hypothetical protein